MTFAIEEGIQHRMGQLKIERKNDVAEELKTTWKLKPGKPYDPAYLERFLTQNRESLPDEFNNDRDVLWLRDCSDITINVTIELDPRRQWKPKPQDKPCEKPKPEPKTTDKPSV